MNASIVWRWTKYHESRRSQFSLRQLTSSDSVCRPTLSLAPIWIILGAISINSHWLEPSYQVSRSDKYSENISLLLIVSDPEISNLLPNYVLSSLIISSAGYLSVEVLLVKKSIWVQYGFYPFKRNSQGDTIMHCLSYFCRFWLVNMSLRT